MIHTWRTEETDPARRGEELATRWRPQVHATLAEYQALFEDRAIPAAVVKEIANDSRDLVAEHAPEILAEIDGIAAGAGLDPWQAMALNARTEILARAAVVTDECSTAVLLPADGSPPRTMQTWDWYSHMARQTLACSQPSVDGTRIAIYAEFGQVAKIGVSTRGVGVHLNILQHATDGTQLGVPVHILARMILDRAATVAQALEIVDSVPLGASTVLTVMTREPAAACLELSPAGWAALPAVPGKPLLHTNHFLDATLAAGGVISELSTTRERIDYLRGHAAAFEESDPVARVTGLASEAPGSICVDPDPRRAEGDRPETKTTVTIDVARAELGLHPSHPRAVAAHTWQTIAA